MTLLNKLTPLDLLNGNIRRDVGYKSGKSGLAKDVQRMIRRHQNRDHTPMLDINGTQTPKASCKNRDLEKIVMTRMMMHIEVTKCLERL